VEVCDSGEEALNLMSEIDDKGDFVALIISDQVMPEMTGVDLLTKITSDGRFDDTQKILLTGLATHQDTIEAINTGGIDHYIEKPWQKERIISVVKKSLTSYIMNKGLDYEPVLDLLDQETLYKALKNNT
jgi:two-component system chemotaxis response regulator CheY